MVHRLLPVGSFILIASLSIVAAAQPGREAMAESLAWETRLAEALSDVARGSYDAVYQFEPFTARAVPVLRDALRHENEAVRREAVTRLASIDDRDALAALATALDDPSADIARRAADALHDQGAAALAAPGVVDALRATVGSRMTHASGLLLLAHAPSDEATIDALEAARSTYGAEETRLSSNSAAVPVSYVVDTVLAGHGVEDARRRTLAVVESGDEAARLFLLDALRDVMDPKVLEALATQALADHRPTRGDAPAHVEPPVRIADVAAARFIAHFGLDLGFQASGANLLSDSELEAVQSRVQAKISGTGSNE